MDVLKVPILKRLYPSIIRRFFLIIGRIKFFYFIEGFKFELDIRESIERKTYFQGSYEKKRMSYLVKNSKRIKSNIFLDIGSYIGFYSVLMSNNFEKVHAFEPLKRNFEILSKNINANNLSDKIETYKFGLGNKKAKLFGGSNKKGKLMQSSGFSLIDRKNKNEEISIIKGDDILKYEDKTITIKIDVEGFELEVLKGIKELLLKNTCFLQIEIWEHNNENVNLFLNDLKYNFIKTIDGDTYYSNIK